MQLEGAVKERRQKAFPPSYRAHSRVANLSRLGPLREIEMYLGKNVVLLSVCRSLLFEAGLWGRRYDGWAGPSPPSLLPRHCLIRTSRRRRSRLNIQKTFVRMIAFLPLHSLHCPIAIGSVAAASLCHALHIPPLSLSPSFSVCLKGRGGKGDPRELGR